MKEANKKALALITVVLMIAVSAITVAAYLFINSGPVSNTFNPAEDTNPAISETFNNSVKEEVSVSVGNPGYAVYVRAAIVVTWKTSVEDGSKVLGDVPVLGTDYSMTLNVGDGDDKAWFLGSDGFYYHKAPVSSGNTSVLISSASPNKTMSYDSDGDGTAETYYLSIDIVSQTIQALGTTDDGTKRAIEDAWGKIFTFDGDGNITAVS